jgi:hypothetical protein
MYFSDMWCYGESRDMAGITGISGCMGVVYVGHRSIYAIHIPDQGHATNTEAGRKFGLFVKNLGEACRGHGALFGFANRTQRLTAGTEMAGIKQELGLPNTSLYRIKWPPQMPGRINPKAVAIKVQRAHVSAANLKGCVIQFKADESITWISGGEPPNGFYRVNGRDRMKAKIPSDLTGGWWGVNRFNCDITEI